MQTKKILILIAISLALAGCASSKNSSVIDTNDQKIAKMCKGVLNGNFPSNSNFKSLNLELIEIANSPDFTNLKLKPRIIDLANEAELLSTGASTYTASFKFFCEDFVSVGEINQMPSVEKITTQPKESDTAPTWPKAESNVSDPSEISREIERKKEKAIGECIISLIGNAGFSNDDLINANYYCRNKLK